MIMSLKSQTDQAKTIIGIAIDKYPIKIPTSTPVFVQFLLIFLGNTSLL